MLKCDKLKLSEFEAWRKVDKHLIDRLNNNKTATRPQVHAYYCRDCKAWHTTTIPEKVINNFTII